MEREIQQATRIAQTLNGGSRSAAQVTSILQPTVEVKDLVAKALVDMGLVQRTQGSAKPKDLLGLLQQARDNGYNVQEGHRLTSELDL